MEQMYQLMESEEGANKRMVALDNQSAGHP